MSLTKEKIVSNTKRYLEAAKKYNAFTRELEDILGADLIKAPASTMTKLHCAYEGGLIDHTLRVMKHAHYINKNNFSDKHRVDENSLFKVVLLHQIGKVNLYIPETSKWHIENQGRMYNFNENITSMRVGERSAYYALKSGVELNDEEFIAIVNHDKTDDVQSEWHNSKIGDILKISIKLAIIEEKLIENE